MFNCKLFQFHVTVASLIAYKVHVHVLTHCVPCTYMYRLKKAKILQTCYNLISNLHVHVHALVASSNWL